MVDHKGGDTVEPIRSSVMIGDYFCGNDIGNGGIVLVYLASDKVNGPEEFVVRTPRPGSGYLFREELRVREVAMLTNDDVLLTHMPPLILSDLKHDPPYLVVGRVIDAEPLPDALPRMNMEQTQKFALQLIEYIHHWQLHGVALSDLGDTDLGMAKCDRFLVSHRKDKLGSFLWYDVDANNTADISAQNRAVAAVAAHKEGLTKDLRLLTWAKALTDPKLDPLLAKLRNRIDIPRLIPDEINNIRGILEEIKAVLNSNKVLDDAIESVAQQGILSGFDAPIGDTVLTLCKFITSLAKDNDGLIKIIESEHNDVGHIASRDIQQSVRPVSKGLTSLRNRLYTELGVQNSPDYLSDIPADQSGHVNDGIRELAAIQDLEDMVVKYLTGAPVIQEYRALARILSQTLDKLVSRPILKGRLDHVIKTASKERDGGLEDRLFRGFTHVVLGLTKDIVD